MICSKCSHNEFFAKKIKKIFEIDNKVVVIDNFPVLICKKCGEENFSKEALANIQDIVTSDTKCEIKSKNYEYSNKV